MYFSLNWNSIYCFCHNSGVIYQLFLIGCVSQLDLHVCVYRVCIDSVICDGTLESWIYIFKYINPCLNQGKLPSYHVYITVAPGQLVGGWG